MVESYNIEDDTWSIENFNLPRPRSGFSCCILNDNFIFIVGGNDGSVLDSVQCYDIKNQIWNDMPSLNTKRDELAVTVGPDGMVYAIGGYGGPANTCLSSVERFNQTTQEWETVAPLNEPR